ncbi:MAG TPA: hypothetical protein VL092_13780, partial [Chitinophagaceae bacterium]|nr:hypothetical protein [Chitinophagaceae bacterium]
RTPGPVTVSGFQDRRNRPLCHLSAAKVIIGNDLQNLFPDLRTYFSVLCFLTLAYTVFVGILHLSPCFSRKYFYDDQTNISFHICAPAAGSLRTKITCSRINNIPTDEPKQQQQRQ